MRTIKRQLVSCLYALAFVAITSGAGVCADSASFDPVPIHIKAVGSGVPIGTVITWPVSSNPVDFDNWLECNGQAISQSDYPELYALVGGTVPNYQGLFLRGRGSQVFNSGGYGAVAHASGNLGVVQGDAIRNITGDFIGDSVYQMYIYSKTGAFLTKQLLAEGDGGQTGYGEAHVIGFDSSRVVPTGLENRPVNMAVRYLIRARN